MFDDPTSCYGSDSAKAKPQGGPRLLSGRFGRYEIVRLLGEGGMGQVYLATDTLLRRDVALKIPHEIVYDDELLLKRFFREAELAARLNHPNIFSVFDMGDVNGVHYIAMAYVRGETLAAYLADRQAMEQYQAACLVAEIARAMSAVHDAGVLHRDLKPANIMLDQDGRPIVMDFGLAFPLSSPTRLTLDGTVLGTAPYIPREQFEGGADANQPHYDVYSLGIIFYQLLTGGELPYDGDETARIQQLLDGKCPRTPREFTPDLDERLTTVCLRAIAPAVEDRFRSMRDFAAALDQVTHPPDSSDNDS